MLEINFKLFKNHCPFMSTIIIRLEIRSIVHEVGKYNSMQFYVYKSNIKIQVYTRQQEEMRLGSVNFAQIMLLFVVLTNCIQIPALSKQKLHHIQYVPDNIHRFIFLNQFVHDQLKNSVPVGEKIQYYTHICSKDASLLSVCNEKQNTPIMLAYNKMIFSYEVHRSTLSNEALAEDVSSWINLVLRTNHKKNLKEQQILEILKKNNQLVLIIENATMRQFQSAAQILSKQFPYIDVIYLSDTPHSDKYGLETGDIIHIKNLQASEDFQFSDLASIIKNNTLTTLLVRQAPKRYDIMKLFVLQNIFTRGFAKETEGLERKRFELKVRSVDQKIEGQQQRILLVNCDLSSDCVRFWKLLDGQLWSKKYQIDSSTIFRRILFRFQIRKNIQVLQIYYHLKLQNKNKPYVLVLDGQDPQVPNLPIRYLKELQLQNPNPLGQINTFLNEINLRRVQKISMTSGIPKKNGFTGKGSQKFIQKLSYQTYKKVLKEARDKQEYYFLYVTANEFECSQCKQFYNELKKLAAFLHSENQMKITFGVYDLSKDQIDFKYLDSIPSVLLFTPDEDRPVEYKNRYEFEQVLNFLNKQIAKSQNKRNKVYEQTIQMQIDEPQL